jgi:hypothetical protein
VHATTGTGAAYAPTLSPAAMTLGVLAVPPGAAALLAHDEHPDLHIGPGVYALRRQRAAALPTTTPARATTPEPTTVPVWD